MSMKQKKHQGCEAYVFLWKKWVTKSNWYQCHKNVPDWHKGKIKLFQWFLFSCILFLFAMGTVVPLHILSKAEKSYRLEIWIHEQRILQSVPKWQEERSITTGDSPNLVWKDPCSKGEINPYPQSPQKTSWYQTFSPQGGFYFLLPSMQALPGYVSVPAEPWLSTMSTVSIGHFYLRLQISELIKAIL